MAMPHDSHYPGLEKLSSLGSVKVHPDREAAFAGGQAANREMWKWIVFAAGAGLLGRAGLGLTRLIRPEADYAPTPSYQPISIGVPDDPVKKKQREKQSKDKTPVDPIINWLSNSTAPLWGKNMFTSGGNPYAVPALWALGLPAALGAGIGSWHLTDKLLDSRRKSEHDQELAAVQAEYEKMLRETLGKRAEVVDDDLIEYELESLASDITEGITKQANPAAAKTHYLTDYPRSLAGLIAAWGVLSALASGKMSYDYFNKRSPERITEEALRRRSKERAGGVEPIYLQPLSGNV